MSWATLDDRDAGAGGRNRTRVGGVQVRCTTAVRRQPGSRMSESNRSRRCTGALSRRETSSGRSRGDRRALPGGLHRGRAWESCQGSHVFRSATGGTRTRTGEAPLGISVRDVYQFRTTVAWCQRGDSNSHGDYAPTGSEPVTSTSSKHAGVVWAVGIEPTWSCSRSRRDNRCPTPRLRKMERARGVEPLSVCLEGRRLADHSPAGSAKPAPAGLARYARSAPGQTRSDEESGQRESNPHPSVGNAESCRWTMAARAERGRVELPAPGGALV